ncbi:cytochrome b/b6 domain-containing protein [Undibacterium sp. CY18W]|uniref:Cytochrome b/b6 domain-containing protein n=1 Tax=Undibacterium hunanense TaxID=2762292 RepID=A0ABR6ZUK4_9BURK|nr:cytochrome b/b6 domain-containing protein [Undibacterium hunanense]MBC3919200.1 cytochrome b/b6 domain-containing protein [Undibacterium hunanense]
MRSARLSQRAKFSVLAFDLANKDLRHNVVELHGLLVNILLALVAFHATAALWHGLVKKDSVLRRMLQK